MRSQTDGLSLPHDEREIDPADPEEVRYWARRYRAPDGEIRRLAVAYRGSAKAVREHLGAWNFGEAE